MKTEEEVKEKIKKLIRKKMDFQERLTKRWTRYNYGWLRALQWVLKK